MANKNRSVLVTGSSGFIGNELVLSLVANDHIVQGLDQAAGWDITLTSNLREYFGGIAPGDIDSMFHLAAKMFVPAAWENPLETYKINTMGTLNMLEMCRELDVTKFIFASSYIYGAAEYLPIDEKHPLAPGNPYAHSKYLAEKACRAYSNDYGINCIVLRPFNVYGPGQNPDFLIPTIINQLGEGKISLKDPEPKRDFLYLTDMVSAYQKAAELKGDKFEVFNIGSGKSHSVSEIVELVLAISGKDVPVEYTGERRPGEVMDTVADITKAKEKLGWEPEVTIESGLKELLADNLDKST